MPTHGPKGNPHKRRNAARGGNRSATGTSRSAKGRSTSTAARSKKRSRVNKGQAKKIARKGGIR